MSRADTKAKKLPAGLPPLPPVPEGFDGWEYMGKGWVSAEPVAYGAFKPGYTDWVVHKSSQSAGSLIHHYIRAIIGIRAPKKGARS